MRKIIFIILVSISVLSCTNREYCRACENEILKINKELSANYESYGHMHFMAMTFGPSNNERYMLTQAEEKIKELKNRRTYYELEIKKHSRKWEFDSRTKRSYNDLKKYEK